MTIDYRYIQDAIDFYERRDYVQVEVPWLISKEAYHATKPADATDLYVANWDKYLAASGEQSFIEMMLGGRDFKRAQCVTPCFRDDKEDDIHHKFFMKVELIKADEVSVPHLFSVIHDAMSFFETHSVNLKVVQKSEVQYDLLCKTTRVELGSYGIREYKNLKWIYGTGIAEPRFSKVLDMKWKKVHRAEQNDK